MLRWGTVAYGVPVVGIEVRVSTVPTEVETNDLPVSVTSVCIGTTVYVETWVTNWGSDPPGLAGGSIDITFPPSLVEGESIDHGTLFDELTTGVIDNVEGVVDDLGGNTLDAGVATVPTWGLLARVSFTAVTEGDAIFSLSRGAFRFALAGGQPPLDFDRDVAFGPPAYLHVGAMGFVGDYNCDGDVDLDDFAAFQTCLGGPGTLVDECGMAETDEDGDGDTDFLDFAVFQTNFTGSIR